LGWVAAFVCAALPARAQQAAPTYSLSWVRGEGAEECPTARAVAAEVERRLGRPVFDAAAARSFEVQVARVAGQYRSDVFVRDEAGRSLGHRSLQSDEPGCNALFGATALAIALVIDPEAASRQPAASAAFEAPPAPAAPPPAPAPPPPPPVVAAPPPPLPTALPQPAPRALVSMVLRGQLSGGLVPEPAPGVGLGLAARPSKRWGFAAAAWYTPPKRALRGEGDFEIGLGHDRQGAARAHGRPVARRFSPGCPNASPGDRRRRLRVSGGRARCRVASICIQRHFC
jgi:hypothetical protein